MHRFFYQHYFNPCFPVLMDKYQYDTRQMIPTISHLRLIEDRVPGHNMPCAYEYDKLLVSPWPDLRLPPGLPCSTVSMIEKFSIKHR